MQFETALLAGGMTAVGVYMILQTDFIRILLGFMILSNAANVFLLAMSGAPDDKKAPIVDMKHSGGITENLVDPLPQALILTAIVIGFGVIAYLTFLLYRIFLDFRTCDSATLFRPETKPESERSR